MTAVFPAAFDRAMIECKLKQYPIFVRRRGQLATSGAPLGRAGCSTLLGSSPQWPSFFRESTGASCVTQAGVAAASAGMLRPARPPISYRPGVIAATFGPTAEALSAKQRIAVEDW